MSIILRLPPVNPIRFAEADAAMPGKFGYPLFGTALQIDSNRQHAIKEQYYQQVAASDPVCFQYHRGRTGRTTELHNPSELRIFDTRTGIELKLLNPTSVYTLNGVADEITGEQLYTEQFLFTPASISELNGKKGVYFELWHYYDNYPSAGFKFIRYRSNPIELRASFPNTSLVEYNQSVNGHDILFEQLQPRFAYRIESTGMGYEPGGDYTVFEDQDRSTVTLDAESFNIFKWDIGGTHGLPEYMVDIVNRSLQCCKDGYFRVDGREYVWSDGKLENTGGEGKHLQWRSVTLRQAHEPDGYTITQRKIPLFTAPAFPFAINACALSDRFTSVTVMTNGAFAKVFDDSSALNVWIGSFNTNLAAAGFAGTIVRDGNDVVLNNAEGERLNLILPVKLLPRLLTLTETAVISGSGRFSRYKLTYPDTKMHSHVVCYGATSGTEELKNNTFGTNSVTVTHEWTSDGTQTVRIFHNDEETGFESISNTFLSNIANITNITGVVSNKLNTFNLPGHNFSALPSGALDLAFLAPAKGTLTNLSLKQCELSAIKPTWASSLTTGSYKPFWRLSYIDISTNHLTSAAVDDFINEFYNYCNVGYGSYVKLINLSANLPAAPPTASSAASRAGLAGSAWLVATD